jgi:hypothetical protein
MTHQSIVPSQRREATQRNGALTLDTVYAAGSVASLVGAPYVDPQTLSRFAIDMLKIQSGEAYLHVFHSARAHDLVFATGSAVASWWTTSGLVPVTDWSDADTNALREDAALRTAAGTIEAQGISAAFDAISRAAVTARGRAELLKFAGSCIAVNKLSVAGKIVDDFLAIDPRHPRALMLDAKMTMTLVSTKQWPPERLRKADAQLSFVVETDPRNLEARLLHADVPRYGGDALASVPRFEALLRDFPSCDAAHYNLAVIHLPARPELALEHFARGRALAPKDADYVVGEARALIALRRATEARDRLREAERLRPDHPMLGKLKAQLGG